MTSTGRPRLLDLFCGQGGAGMGYARAGFDVTGVDIAGQPRYPFAFRAGDALEYVAAHGPEYDAIHASPPCQAYTTMSNRHRGKGGKADGWPELIGRTRELLAASGRPWVLENVAGARSAMRDPFLLHGGMFGLRVYRPRLFEATFPVLLPVAAAPRDPVGVYGKAHDGRRLFTRRDGSEQHAAGSLAEARDALEMSWADWDGCREAVPPAYTELIGVQLLRSIR